jgi:hypothetical protein
MATEFALVLPFLLAMAMGMIQLAWIGLATCYSHHALHSALRAYSVHQEQGEQKAMRKANAAMRQALAWGPGLRELELSIEAEKGRRRGERPSFSGTLSARLPLPISRGGRIEVSALKQAEGASAGQ